MKKIALILSGCGHLDGAEIRETVLTLLALDKNDANYEIFAPKIKLKEVINHATNEVMQEAREVFTEVARLARGEVLDIKELEVEQFDALIMPGGFGIAKNFSNISDLGAHAEVIAEIKTIIREFYKRKKPIGAICIAPALIALCLKDLTTPRLTLGNESTLLENMGLERIKCDTYEIVVDHENKLVSTPAYMHQDRISQIAQGIEKLVKKVLEL